MTRDQKTATPGQSKFDRQSSIVVGLMAVTWMIVLAAFSIARHQRLNSTAYDLAIKSQVIWNTFKGDWFASSIEVSHYLGDHVAWIMLPIASLFALWEDVRLLLILQSIMLSLGAIPVYRIARRHLYTEFDKAELADEKMETQAENKKNRLPDLPRISFPLALLFAAVYLLYPTIGFVNRFDFHPITFTIFFLLMAYDLLESDKPAWATLFVFLALSCREDVGFTVFAFGLYVAFAMKRRQIGLIWSVTGLIWSLTAIFVIIPYFRGTGSDTLARYSWLGNDPVSILQMAVTQPRRIFDHITEPYRVHFLLKLLLPLGYLPLLSPLPLLITLPALAYNLLSVTPSQSSIYFHYISPIIPFIFISGIQGATWTKKKLGQRSEGRKWINNSVIIAGWLILWTLIAWKLDNPFTKVIDEPYFPVYALEQVTDGDAFWAARELISPEASVATSQSYAPHVALRSDLVLFHNRLRMEEYEHGFPQAEYLLLNLADYRWGVNARLFHAALETAIGKYGYEAIYFDNDVVLLTRDASLQPATGAVIQRMFELQEAGGKFAPAAESTLDWIGQQWLVNGLPEAAIAHPTQFAGGINLLGYDLNEPETSAGRPFCVSLYWQTETGVSTPYTVFIHFVAPDGFVHAQSDSQPVQGFYPFTRWHPGEIFADLHCFQIPPHLHDGRYSLNVGLYDPENGRRLETISLQTDVITLPTDIIINQK